MVHIITTLCQSSFPDLFSGSSSSLHPQAPLPGTPYEHRRHRRNAAADAFVLQSSAGGDQRAGAGCVLSRLDGPDRPGARAQRLGAQPQGRLRGGPLLWRSHRRRRDGRATLQGRPACRRRHSPQRLPLRG